MKYILKNIRANTINDLLSLQRENNIRPNQVQGSISFQSGYWTLWYWGLE